LKYNIVRCKMLEEILEVFEYQGKLIKFDEVLIHYEKILKELEEEAYE